MTTAQTRSPGSPSPCTLHPAPSAATLFDKSRPGRRATTLPPLDVPPSPLPPKEALRQSLRLPEVSELDLVRHFVTLSQKNFSVDTTFYPLGSCTMKYNPKRNEEAARLPGFAQLHPHQDPEAAQGALEVMWELQRELCQITGMEACSLAPAAGAQGELSGMLMIRSYHLRRGDMARRTVLVPDSAHGTNPATAAMCGYDVISLKSNREGNVHLADLRQRLGPHVAGLMLTLPSTLGLFDVNVQEICRLVHEAGGLVYGDGANLNALLGRARPGDLGFDVIHINLHKTCSTPHGGGGPGAGPVCAGPLLAPYLPEPVVDLSPGPLRQAQGRLFPTREGVETAIPASRYRLTRPACSIGKVGTFHGNFGVLLRAYAYLRTLGPEGLREVADHAVLNANYLLARLRGAYHLPYDRTCMHEVVLSGLRQRDRGVRTLDVAKRLLDYGFHAPTIYFPLLVEEALMIEPTETESKETLDAFVEAMLAIAREAQEEPALVTGAPGTTPIGRLNEAEAARRPVLRWQAPAGT
ncbi:MAG: aminomethyl-transferring glycine dehydrogenase subunit GcvPB [Chloroflexi bacterium]|nr:aminomethyl-transferring glycine dehydrogenase subunit GcvPB [Chloroflexota bacterium]